MQTVGDGIFVAFADAAEALAACVDAQQALASHRWPVDGELRVRMGLDTGIATPTPDGNYLALAVHQAAHICAAAHGGQILLSSQTAALVRDVRPDDVSLVDRGLFMFRSYEQPERIFQLAHPDLPASFPAVRAVRPCRRACLTSVPRSWAASPTWPPWRI